MPNIDQAVAGAAIKTRLSGSWSGVAPAASDSFGVVASTGYPSADPFVITIDRGLATEEKVLISERSGNTWTVGERGYDGTSPQDHSANAPVEHLLDAALTTRLIGHANDDFDDHASLLNTTRHDVTTRHTFGAAFATPAAGADIATAGATGSAAGPARADHTHKIGAGAINSTGMFASASVPTAAVVDAAITLAKMANLAQSTLIGRATASTGPPEAVTLATDLEMSGGALRVKAYSGGHIAKAAGAALATISNGVLTQAMAATGFRFSTTDTFANRPGSPSVGDLFFQTNAASNTSIGLYVWDGTRWRYLGGDSGGVGKAGPTYAEVTATSTATTTTAGGFKQITLDVEVSDVGALFLSNQYVAPYDGVLEVAARASVASVVAGERVIVSIFKAGAEQLRGFDAVAQGTQSLGGPVAGKFSVSASQAIDLRVFTTSARSTEVGGAIAYLTARMVP